MALHVDSSAHSERVLSSKDARYSHLPVAEFVNLSVPKKDYREQAYEILASLGEASDFLATRLRQKIDQYSVS
jgi:hypothetical protein